MRRQRARKQRKNIALALLALLCLGLIDILFLYIWKTDILQTTGGNVTSMLRNY